MAASSRALAIRGKPDGERRKLDAKPANPLTYPQSASPFNPELFQNPTSEYRGCPFWAWNTKLKKDQLLRQIDHFKEMGLGGFHVCYT
jgi:hypothetical protein